ncbi:uncharacterized protein LOC120695336 [Panicum virgatum]|uniref:uncharacterized protein LOC120695336 n=1 Tax=Panicum virgatum TaxID=38727 RepID=UPI0019D66324|nr:uncharacterized protein LOC120695336 [Panicum virgatum]
MGSHFTCEVCGNDGHSGNDCPETCEDYAYLNNNNNSFNKKVESLLAQIAASVPVSENVKAVTTRGGKSTRDPPHPNHVEKAPTAQEEEQPTQQEETREPEKGMAPQDYIETSFLSFPTRNRKAAVDEQLTRFVEMIQKIHVNVPLLDVMHVPTYTRYIKENISNKRPLPTTKVVKLTEECSASILNQPLEKKKDPGCPTITCSIGAQHFSRALCDLGASVSVMPKAVYDKVNFTYLTPTPMHLQLADSSVRYPEGIAEDVPVKVRDYFIPVDFVVLDMDISKDTPLILGRPFLSTAGTQINVGAREIRFNINGKEERFPFQPKVEQCSMIKIKFGPNP